MASNGENDDKFRKVHRRQGPIRNVQMTIQDFKKSALKEMEDKVDDDEYDVYFKFSDHVKLSDLNVRGEQITSYAFVGREGSDTGAVSGFHNVLPDSDFPVTAGAVDGTIKIIREVEDVEGEEGDGIAFDVARTATISDIESLLRGRGIGGRLQKIRNHSGDVWNIENSREEDLKKEIIYLTDKPLDDVLHVSTARDIDVWPKRVTFYDGDSRFCRLPLCQENTLQDILKMLENRGLPCEVAALYHKRAEKCIYDKHDEGNDKVERTLEYIPEIQDGDEIQIFHESDVTSTAVEGDEPRGECHHMVHFQIGRDRTKLNYDKRLQISQVIEMLGIKEELRDISVKRRSFLNILLPKSDEQPAKDAGSQSVLQQLQQSVETLEDCNVNEGDVIEIVLESSPKEVKKYRVKQMKHFVPTIQAIEKGGGDNVKDLERNILRKCQSTSSNDAHPSILFEYHVEDHKNQELEYFRPVYEKDEPPFLKCGDDHCLNLYLNCEYFDIIRRESAQDSAEWKWLWALEKNKYWVSGVKVTCSKTHSYILFLQMDNGTFVDIDDRSKIVEDPKDFPVSDKINIPENERQTPSMFISFLPSSPSCLFCLPKESVVRIYKRLEKSDLPAGREAELQDRVDSMEFWIQCDKKEATKLTEKMRKESISEKS